MGILIAAIVSLIAMVLSWRARTRRLANAKKRAAERAARAANGQTIPGDTADFTANPTRKEIEGPAWRQRLIKALQDNGVSQPPRELKVGRARVVVGIMLVLGGALSILWFTFNGSVADEAYDLPGLLAQRDEGWHRMILTPIVILIYFVGLIFGGYFFRRGQRTLAPDAFAELDRLPDRHPLLFLRSFSRDPSDTVIRSGFAVGDSFELAVAKELHEIGPVIAIGKPEERLPPIGAGRLYVTEDRWQPTVLELISASQLILLVSGATKGLLWELRSIVEQADPSKLIVCIPGDKSATRRRTAWKEFRELTHDVFPKPLPEDPGWAIFMHFDKLWNPVLVGARLRLTSVGSRTIRTALRSIILRDSNLGPGYNRRLPRGSWSQQG